MKDKIKILIIDDEKQFTEELGGFLLDSDYEFYETNTAAEGKKVLKNNKIDLLILDVRLPGGAFGTQVRSGFAVEAGCGEAGA